MSLTESAYKDRMWKDLETLMAILSTASGKAEYSRSVDYRFIERLDDILKIHGLCINYLDTQVIETFDIEKKNQVGLELAILSNQIRNLIGHLTDALNELDDLTKSITKDKARTKI